LADNPIFADLCRHVARIGLLVRGGFHPEADSETRTIVMVGNAGPDMWAAFEAGRPDAPDPLDTWCRSGLEAIADAFGARLVMPSDGPPYAPFQQWAMRAEPVHPSPLGILIHPRWGLWHGYRGAFLFAETLELPPPETGPSPCATCQGKPCLSACQVGAFTTEGYDVPACTAHLASSPGNDCLAGGCLARRACPVGHARQGEAGYPEAQAAFHMTAFLRSNG